MRVTGFEPVTEWLKVTHSTNWVKPPICYTVVLFSIVSFLSLSSSYLSYNEKLAKIKQVIIVPPTEPARGKKNELKGQ